MVRETDTNITDCKSTRYRTKKNKDLAPVDELVKIFIEQGIITLDEIMNSNQEGIMENILLKVHPYELTAPKEGGRDERWSTYVIDSRYKGHRRQIRKNSREELILWLLDFYGVGQKETKDNKTFEQLYFDYVEYKKNFLGAKNTKKSISRTTLTRYVRDYNNHIKYCPFTQLPINLINPVMIEKQLRDMMELQDLSESMGKNIMGYMSKVLDYAQRSRYLDYNLYDEIDKDIILAFCNPPEVKDDSVRVLSLSEEIALYNELLRHEAKHPTYMPNYACELAMLIGCRIGELAALHYSDIRNGYIHIDFSEHRIDYEDGRHEIVIGEPKNRKHRAIPVTEEIQELLDRIQSLGLTSKEDFIFVREDGSRYTESNIARAVYRRGVEAGIKEPVSIHRIRRTVSSKLRQVATTELVANMLGHTVETNDGYYAYDTKDRAEKIVALSSINSYKKKSA